MKRFWLLALLMAGSLAMALVSPVFAAKMSSEDGGSDSSDTMEDVNSALGSMSAKINEMDKQLGLKFFGDIRLRYAFATQSVSSTTKQSQANGGQNTIFDQGRGRYRARIGAMKTMGDVTGGLRLSTGATNNPNSENNTFDTGFTNPAINIDTAYLAYTPSWLEGHLKLQAGKFNNPLTKTPITWDPDIQPEGALVEISKDDFKARATYFDLINQAGKYYSDEYMANFQLEQNVKIDNDTAVGLMVGYEYIPYTQILENGSGAVTTTGLSTGVVLATGPLAAGNVNDPNNGGGIRDFQVGEAMLTFKHKVGDVPFKWTLHVTDNFDGGNLPVAPSGAVTGYTNFSNQYAEWLGVEMGAMAKGGFTGSLAVAQLDPNCQLANLTDDDPGNTNRQYAVGVLNYGLEDNVVLTYKQFVIYHEYYAYLPASGNLSLGGTSNQPEFITFLDAMASF